MAYSHQARQPMTLRRNHTEAGTLAMPRRRGASTGTLLVLLGIWGAIIPFIGPIFGYRMDAVASWTFTWDRLWLNILPGAAAFFGGLILIGAADRLSATVGSWLAVAGGVWFVVGPSFSLLWNSPVGMTGVGIGSNTQRFIEQIGYFYGLGAVVTALAAGAWARLMVRSERDAALLEPAAADTVTTHEARRDDVVTTDPYAGGAAGAERYPTRTGTTTADPMAGRVEPADPGAGTLRDPRAVPPEGQRSVPVEGDVPPAEEIRPEDRRG